MAKVDCHSLEFWNFFPLALSVVLIHEYFEYYFVHILSYVIKYPKMFGIWVFVFIVCSFWRLGPEVLFCLLRVTALIWAVLRCSTCLCYTQVRIWLGPLFIYIYFRYLSVPLLLCLRYVSSVCYLGSLLRLVGYFKH